MESQNLIARLNDALAGRYQVERQIGAGGMAWVYLAGDLRHHRAVALKVLRPDVAEAVGAGRFLREIQIAAQLQHPNILPLLDSGEADGLVFYVMPYVNGPTLRDRLNREGELPVEDAVRILVEVTDALGSAHEQGVVHRDVKPDNVMLSGRHAMVADFGVARALAPQGGDEADRITTVGTALGTPAYMAPEQATADPLVDHRADIYAVGVLAYEMLTGHPPFSGRVHREILAAQLTQEAKPLSELRPGVPPELEAVVHRCLAKRPADRWQSAEELRERLEPMATPASGTEPATVPLRRGWGSMRRWRLMPGLVLAVLAAGAVFVAIRGGLWGTGGVDVAFSIGHATRLTAEPGLETHPAISPDGSLVAYAAGEATSLRIYIRPVMGGRTIALTEASTAMEFAPRWSPDGTRILFLTPDGARIASALGGASQSVAAAGDHAGPYSSYGSGQDVAVNAAAWSPDGTRVFIGRGGRLSIVDLESGDETPLDTLDYEVHSCDWSPLDWIACTAGNWEAVVPGNTYGNIAPSAVVLVNAVDGRVEEVTDRSSLNESPAWSPDGRVLYFVSNRQGPRDIYGVEIGADGRPRGAPVRVTAGIDAQSMDFSGNGSRLTYGAYSASANIWSLPIPSDGVPVDPSRATRLTSEHQIVEAMRVSFDGQWLLYDSNVSGNAEIYRIPVGGGAPERLTEHPSDDFAPDLSPDGREIAYHSWRSGSRDIFVQPVAGGAPQQITDSPWQESYPVWSPDGRALAYWDQWQEGGETRGLFLVRRDGDDAWGEPELLRTGTNSAAWSPDGRLLAYSRYGAIEVLRPGSGEPAVVYRPSPGTDDPESEKVVVSEDGRRLFFKAHDAEGNAGIWSVPVTGGEPRLLVRFDASRPSIRADFAAGAGRFFFTLDDRQSDIWVAEIVGR